MHDKLISNYSHLITQIVLLAIGGITAEITLMTISSFAFKNWMFVLVVVFLALSVVAGIIGLIMLFGEARDEKPNIDDPWVFYPQCASLIAFILGFIIFLSQFVFLENKPKEMMAQFNLELRKEEVKEIIFLKAIDSLSHEQKQEIINLIEKQILENKSKHIKPSMPKTQPELKPLPPKNSSKDNQPNKNQKPPKS